MSAKRIGVAQEIHNLAAKVGEDPIVKGRLEDLAREVYEGGYREPALRGVEPSGTYAVGDRVLVHAEVVGVVSKSWGNTYRVRSVHGALVDDEAEELDLVPGFVTAQHDPKAAHPGRFHLETAQGICMSCNANCGHVHPSTVLAPAAPDAVRIAELESLLRALEWSGSFHVDYDEHAPCCPKCEGLKEPTKDTRWTGEVGHQEGCPFPALIAPKTAQVATTGTPIEIAPSLAVTIRDLNASVRERVIAASTASPSPRIQAWRQRRDPGGLHVPVGAVFAAEGSPFRSVMASRIEIEADEELVIRIPRGTRAELAVSIMTFETSDRRDRGGVQVVECVTR